MFRPPITTTVGYMLLALTCMQHIHLAAAQNSYKKVGTYMPDLASQEIKARLYVPAGTNGPQKWAPGHKITLCVPCMNGMCTPPDGNALHLKVMNARQNKWLKQLRDSKNLAKITQASVIESNDDAKTTEMKKECWAHFERKALMLTVHLDASANTEQEVILSYRWPGLGTIKTSSVKTKEPKEQLVRFEHAPVSSSDPNNDKLTEKRVDLPAKSEFNVRSLFDNIKWSLTLENLDVLRIDDSMQRAVENHVASRGQIPFQTVQLIKKTLTHQLEKRSFKASDAAILGFWKQVIDAYQRTT